MTPRRILPRHLEAEVLYLNDHTCCICRDRSKDVQIHHIDGNPANNSIGNLAVVSLDCHSRVTGRRGLGRSYTPEEVRKYKAGWERYVLALRRVRRPQVRRGNKELLSQIDVIVCEIIALNPKNVERAQELLDLLYEIHFYAGRPEITQNILKGLNWLGTMLAMDKPRVAVLLPETIYAMCHEFVGPEHVSMDSKDVERVLAALTALEEVGRFNSLLGHSRKVVDAVLRRAETFFETGMWYGRKRIYRRCCRSLQVGN